MEWYRCLQKEQGRAFRNRPKYIRNLQNKCGIPNQFMILDNYPLFWRNIFFSYKIILYQILSESESEVIQSCPTLCDPTDLLQPTRFLCPWGFPGKNTGVGGHFLLQEIFPTQGLKPGLPHCRQTLYHLSHQEVAQGLSREVNTFYTIVNSKIITYLNLYFCSKPVVKLQSIRPTVLCYHQKCVSFAGEKVKVSAGDKKNLSVTAADLQ